MHYLNTLFTFVYFKTQLSFKREAKTDLLRKVLDFDPQLSQSDIGLSIFITIFLCHILTPRILLVNFEVTELVTQSNMYRPWPLS